MTKFKRTLCELREQAVMHWPEDILNEAGESSILPRLLITQDYFISILKVANKTPDSWLAILQNNESLSAALFLKHLMVISDIGGEALNKLPPLSNYFKDNKMRFDWKGEEWEYAFLEIHKKCPLTNSALGVDSKYLLSNNNFSDKMKDVAYLLLFASSSVNDSLPSEIKERCIIGSLIGLPEALDDFCKKNYLRVSKQLSGATANSLGQITQNYVINKLKQILPNTWSISKDSTLPNVSHSSDGGKTNFDIVVKSPNGKYAGIEVSFQVTTNSVIERKARESENLLKNVHAKGHKVCYVIDGAGNINIRKNAVSILCNNSDCTVAMSENEIKHLAKFLKSNLK